ncbi:MAG TPA: fibronectin type III domain-containing protein [Acidobacteriota bacterium]|nr:fibronectin type III domain-containing protein [Acidobacteriota bacterium]
MYWKILISTTLILMLQGALLADSRSARLEWDPNSETDIAGYNVYRSTGSDGNFVQLNSSPISPTTFTDSTLSTHQIYYFAVTAVNTSGMESDFSEYVSVDLICRGDANGDGQRNVLDVVRIQNSIVGNLSLDGPDAIASDLNATNSIDVLDTVRLLNYLVGNISLPDCP